MDISRPCQPEKLIPLLPWPGFDPSFSGHNDRRAIISEWTWLRLRPLSHRGWRNFQEWKFYLIFHRYQKHYLVFLYFPKWSNHKTVSVVFILHLQQIAHSVKSIVNMLIWIVNFNIDNFNIYNKFKTTFISIIFLWYRYCRTRFPYFSICRLSEHAERGRTF